MKEISLHILDLVQNSIHAHAKQIEIEIISGGNIKKTKNIKCYTLNDYLGNNNL